ncbi:hypothetical protein IHE44_0005444 [Lamprotornis superbus]|uniref:Uncharacterized protein n=1 Tax=Lamprotornis superbus TaxID=245042 RepID=A0A835NXM5_9PASS|nr:hypothetical protein IHE44_0005444 [Lamprotornis superbus]
MVLLVTYRAEHRASIKTSSVLKRASGVRDFPVANKFAVITCSANAYKLRDCCGFSLVNDREWNISGIHRLMDITVACWRKSSVIGFIKGLGRSYRITIKRLPANNDYVDSNSSLRILAERYDD